VAHGVGQPFGEHGLGTRIDLAEEFGLPTQILKTDLKAADAREQPYHPTARHPPSS
jgi:hypothetical protein